MFDGIAYGKAGAVLGMVENYLGEEVFRQGVHNYLQAHLYANATAEDFWRAQTANSHLPVDKIMSSFVAQPGVPLLTFSQVSGGRVPVDQKRFFLSAAPAEGQKWTVPVCVKTNAAPICRVLTPEDAALPLPADAAMPFFYANAGGKGYYRTQYTPEQTAAIISKAETVLTPEERIGLLGDRWALVRSGQGSVGDVLSLVLALKQDPNDDVIASALQKAGTVLARVATKEQRDQMEAIFRREFAPVYAAMGKPSKADSPDRQQLRATLFELLGGGKDPQVLAEAKETATAIYTPGSQPDKTLDASFQDAAILVASENGDAALYDKVLNGAKTIVTPEQQTQALFTLANFEDPALVKRTLDYVVSGQVRNQDSWILLSILLQRPETREQAWEYIKANWEKVQAQFTTNSGVRVVAATGSFCSAEKRDDVASFFASHHVEAADRTLKKAIDGINDCIQFRAAQQPNLKQWLEQHEAK